MHISLVQNWTLQLHCRVTCTLHEARTMSKPQATDWSIQYACALQMNDKPYYKADVRTRFGILVEETVLNWGYGLPVD